MARLQDGIVVAVEGKMARVKTSRHNDCENCGACPGNSAIVIEADNSIGAKQGQFVEMEIQERGLLKAIFVVFLIPLIFAVLGAAIGLFLAPMLPYDRFNVQITCVVIAFTIALVYVRQSDRRAKARAGRQPTITRIHDK